MVLPAFETLPFKSDGNQAADDLTHRVADFAQAAHKDDLQVGFCLLLVGRSRGMAWRVLQRCWEMQRVWGGFGFGQTVCS